MKYASFDGDKIGNSIRNLLLSHKLGEAALLSEDIKRAVASIEKAVHLNKEARLILAGGDDILLAYDSERGEPEIISQIPEIFRRETGLSMSVGVGETISDSLKALNLSKRTGSSIPYLPDAETNKSSQVMQYDDVSLIIFADSLPPDPYINVIQHWLSRKTVRRILLIKIDRDVGKKQLCELELKELKDRIYLQIQLLSELKYLQLKQNTRSEWETVPVSLDEPSRNVYKEMSSRLSSVALSFEFVEYSDLACLLQRVITEGRAMNAQLIFDISTVKKEFIVDIFSILCSEDEREINTFQLVSSPTHSEIDLIHALRCDETYKYVPVASSIYTADKKITSSKNSSNLQDCEQRCAELTTKIDILNHYAERLEDSASEEFSRFWMAIIFFAFVLPLGILVSYWALKGWDDFEKYTFVVPVVLYFVFSFLVTSVFGIKFSLNPVSLKSHLKKRKLKGLSKDRKL